MIPLLVAASNDEDFPSATPYRIGFPSTFKKHVLLKKLVPSLSF